MQNNSLLDGYPAHTNDDYDSFYEDAPHDNFTNPNLNSRNGRKLSTVIGDITDLSDTNLLRSSFNMRNSQSPSKDNQNDNNFLMNLQEKSVRQP